MTRHSFEKKLVLLGAGIVAAHLMSRPVKALVLGNAPQYRPDKVKLNPASPLFGKRVGYLGSSITYGAAAHGVSFVDYLRAQDGVITTKSAISGTTLAGNSPKTYVSRLITDFPLTTAYDAFVIQLSTNDSRQNLGLGILTPDDQRTGFNRSTTLGAIEFICSYIQDHFDAPIIFYTCLRKTDADYSALVTQLYHLQAKWHFTILDLWADPVVKTLTAASPLAMADDAHPTQLGYQTIWTPLFEQVLTRVLASTD
ncbi:SGNH/GDSL hydrolase family protein [Secundilactobacillus paracollinoides]|uniref:SGNH hydrolase n=1 Tax=Secundilactobacillus paracollinoides TaxID=240427 RepID=A0A1B2J0I8_9LACO|nr:SGNH/GDSL hydrolase family protein [Secundilactobacillus paracollinoides]ANZ61887.1 SGNH hydrolase [Secundilactobacillus paracollinoides]ANZ67807.1 SGNH hydrolase [Secundilactobacillus paracollinoides]